MTRLNENHKRKLGSAFKHMDELLGQSLNAAAPSPPGLYSRYVQDLSQSELHWIGTRIERVREQILTLLERFEIASPPPSTPVSWLLKTNLTSLDIVFEDLYPEKMRGYGDMERSTAADLASAIDEIRRNLGPLLAFLNEISGSEKR